MKKVITAHLNRKFTVEDERSSGAVILTTENTGTGHEIVSRLSSDTAIELGENIIYAAGKKAFLYMGRLPIIRDGKNGEGYYDYETDIQKFAGIDTPDSILSEIKVLIAIRNDMIREEAERDARAAEEAHEALKLKLRRDNLTKEFCGSDEAAYIHLSETAKNAVDRVIELEDKLEAKDA